MTPAVSTIIPVLNDNDALRRCLSALKTCLHSEYNQIIVADGGASDECASIAREFGVSYARSERGRAVQMNRASASATGEWLWFLHADCVARNDAIDALLNCEARDLWGCFRHRIDAPSGWLRVIEAADNLRARALQLPYGDQGMFVRAETFRTIGGFNLVPLLEDVLLARKLAELGAPRVLNPVLKSDARRWLKNGILKTTLTNWRIMLEFTVLKKTPHELAAIYYNQK